MDSKSSKNRVWTPLCIWEMAETRAVLHPSLMTLARTIQMKTWKFLPRGQISRYRTFPGSEAAWADSISEAIRNQALSLRTWSRCPFRTLKAWWETKTRPNSSWKNSQNLWRKSAKRSSRYKSIKIGSSTSKIALIWIMRTRKCWISRLRCARLRPRCSNKTKRESRR